MTDWTAGYRADIDYTYGYYAELNPLRAKLAFLNAGLAFPEIENACELGFGQGISVNMHAAGSSTKWYGTDFNPSQAAFARELAAHSQSGAELSDEAFDEFARRDDLPEFDFIGLHGIWSWINDDNRRVIVDFIRRKLRVGGVLYVSYNTLPGWAAFAPMRHLLTEHASLLGSEGKGIVSRVDGAIEFADRLLNTNPVYSRANPTVNDRLKNMKEQNRHYLAHEYFNSDWQPMHFSSMRDWLVDAKVQYACSANFMDTVDSINLTQEQQQLLNGISDPLFKQSVRDFIVNQQFRKDYWVRGIRRLNPVEQREQMRDINIVLTTHADDIPRKVKGVLGEADLTAAVYEPTIDALSDSSLISIGEAEHKVEKRNVSLQQLVQAVSVLSSQSHVAIAQSDGTSNRIRQQCQRQNQFLMARSRGSGDIAYLTSPLTGGGINVNRFQQLFLLAAEQDHQQPEAAALFAWGIIEQLGQTLIKDGKSLSGKDSNIAELIRMAKEFQTKKAPILKALDIL